MVQVVVPFAVLNWENGARADLLHSTLYVMCILLLYIIIMQQYHCYCYVLYTLF